MLQEKFEINCAVRSLANLQALLLAYRDGAKRNESEKRVRKLYTGKQYLISSNRLTLRPAS